MTSKFEELVSAIAAALETLAAGRTLTAQGRSALTEARTALVGISRGSTNYKFTVVAEALAAAIDALERAETSKAAALEQFGKYLARIGASSVAMPSDEPAPRGGKRKDSALGNPGGGIDYHELAKKLDLIANRPSKEQMANPPSFNAQRRNSACWQGLSPYAAAQSAEGNLFYPDSRKWNNEPIKAHFKNAATNAKDLKPQYRRMRVVWHVEGSVATWMRDEGFNDMVLYLNTTMCKYPDGCKEQLAKLLPDGATLKIHGIQPNGKSWHVNITGTGEAII